MKGSRARFPGKNLVAPYLATTLLKSWFSAFFGLFFLFDIFFRLENESVKHCLTHRENRKSKSFFVLEISPGHGVLFSTSVELRTQNVIQAALQR